MIDGGHKNVYVPHLRPRIEAIRKAREIEDQEPLQVDLLMVSHVDDDHMQGILEMTKELITADMDNDPQLVQVLSLWHNSFENLIDHTPKELTAAFKGQFGAASVAGELPNDLTLDADEDEETIVSNLKVLASIPQGAQLRKDAERLDFPLNPEFDGKLILAKKKGKPIDMDHGLKFTVVGPLLPELKKLHAKHVAWLKELKKAGKTPAEVLAAYIDKSVHNLSSIVVLAEAGGKSMFLTGDARGDKILKGLELVGLVKEGGSMHVDVLKVPHHGSANNLDDDFFERITADHYVFSGNGEHGNPERKALEMLLQARGNDDYTVHLTYPIDELDVDRKKDWAIEQKKEKKKKETKPSQVVRPNWSRKKHSLAALFEDNPKFKKKVSLIEEDEEPHVIDLLDEVGF
ncbi:MAG: hypothetical protein AABN95_19875 [Acidobacteriota bacterium]